MHKKFTEEEFADKLDEKLSQIQEPALHFTDKIDSLIKSSENESLELREFKIQLSDILIEFYESMDAVNTEILVEFGVENND